MPQKRNEESGECDFERDGREQKKTGSRVRSPGKSYAAHAEPENILEAQAPSTGSLLTVYQV